VIPEKRALLPRFIRLGHLQLDLFHRDARMDDKWARLHPREFEVLWRLAETPGKILSRRQLLADVWPMSGGWIATAKATGWK